MVAVKKDAATGLITPRHSSGEALKDSRRPQPDAVAAKGGGGAVKREGKPGRRAESRALTITAGTETIPATEKRRSERKGRITLDDLFNKANRLSQLHKPHKANDAGWEAIEMVTARDGELGLNHFKLLKRLGCGDIGSVYLAELRDTKFRFAMKVMDLGTLASRRKQLRAETERDIMSILDHPFLPTLYAHFETPQFLCLVMEYCSGGDLHTLRQKQTGRFFSDKAARFYAAEVLLALEYLHMMGVVYRDLKPENVLIRGDGHVMLSDFDLSLKCSVSPTLLTHSPSIDYKSRDESTDVACMSGSASCLPRSSSRSRRARLTPAPSVSRLVVDLNSLKLAVKPPSSRWKPGLMKSGSGSQRTSPIEPVVPLPELVAEPTGVRSMSFVGTHEYLAPEIISGDGHGSPVDWWTFGIFLYELLYGKTPFKGAENEITLVNVLAQPLEFPEKGDPYYREVDSAAMDLIKALLVKDPQKRLGFNRGATELKQHPFFEGINWALIRCTLPPQIPRALAQIQNPPEKQENGLLPPSKLEIVPIEQPKKYYEMNGDAKDQSTVHFDYF
ncbi:unnamed protein product [Calypogeia fissa]